MDDVDPGKFALCLHNSSFPVGWSTHDISLDELQRRQYGRCFHHLNSKVIAIGGDGGTMGFVDLWRGILLCDVLKVERGKGKPIPSLRYVMLPSSPVEENVAGRGDARLARDIAVVQQGRTIKYVELQVHWKHCLTFKGHYVKDGWMSRTWSRPVAADCSDDCWDLSCKRESSDIPVHSKPHFEPLPKVLDDGGMPLEMFKGLEICQPKISLHDDDGTVCFMAKKNRRDDKAWVIAVDMQNNTLQGVAEFAAGRTIGMSFTLMQSRISKYLMTAPGVGSEE
ncbi:hypothetical protein PVAP13_9NG743500 [Panicum virgatum]|uniref:DUF1618 domain-containing protein n=1 Tax=Panicum virgatum TaxID=38727 RepID=A0A8T0N5M9_PANVG|nr:hypothetical protein PVAP13_9NG743500 [Panicum virgatum]